MMGSSPGCSVEGLRRGAWTKEEDMILSQYIQIHGDGGGWTKLPQKAGLKRSGKSCRLRWLNYLRPDIKRGCISPDEEELIIRLHRLLGNRWSLIAGRLPGRTGNEIKNYWNTHLPKNTQSMNEFQPNWKTQKMKIRSKSPPLPQDYVLKPTPFKLTMAAKHSESGRPVGSNAYGCSNYCSSDEAFELCNVKEATERGAFVMADVNLVEPEGRNSTCAVSSLADEESPNYDHLAGDTATLPESLFESDWTLFSPSGCSIDLGLDEFYRVAAAEMNGFEDIICCDQSNMQSANSFTVADNVGKEEFYYNIEEFLNWVPGVDNNLQK